MKKILAVFLLTIFIVSALPCVSAGFAVNGQTSASVVKAEQWWTRGKPDLTLTGDDIVFSPPSPTEGETVTITATIHNIGEGWARNVKVGFYEGLPEGDLIGTDTIRWLRTGRSEDASVEWTAELGYDICVVADPDDTIDESNEDNNVAYAPNPVAPAEPYADFTADATSGYEPLSVQFTDQSGGFEITSWSWDFGDGGSSDAQNPVHTYEQNGTYTVSLTVTGDGEAVVLTKTKIDYIEVLDTDPVADFTANVTSGNAPLVVQFTDLSTSYDSIVSWEWDFGDVETSIEQNPTHEYSDAGTYTVKLTVSEADGDADTETKIDYITVLAPGAPAYDYELFIEIDYIGDHEPTDTVLDYIKSYYLGNNPTGDLISVTFITTNVTATVIGLGTVNYEDGINDDEFWAIEEAVNDLGDDDYGAVDPIFGTDGVYSSKWKWVLFGTTVENNPNVVGYCYIVRQRIGWWQWDLLAGNYMFIADETADDWATSPELEIGAEAVVLMHEMGHSIGIGILDWRGREVYCGNSECVMSYLSVDNADNYMTWFYCKDHWDTRNMGYY